jgi:ElaB/YqjD/DUF883 family membrane-anchored ribosome-binding protein
MAEKSGELDRNTEYLSESNREKVEAAETMNGENSLEKYDESYAKDSDAANEATDETEQIREQIEETRSNLSETIDAIQEKLSFQNISEQVKDTVSEQINSALDTAKDNVYKATIGKAGKFMKEVGRELSKTDAGKVAANNPFPLFLIGLGVGLFVYQGFTGKKKRKSLYGYKENYKNAAENKRSESILNTAQNKLGDAYQSVSETAGTAYESVSGVAGDAYDKVGGAASSAYEGVNTAANKTIEGVKNFAGSTYEKAGDYSTKAVETYDHYIEENPLAVGAVALAVGAAVGFSIPSSKYERQLLGEYREQVFAKVQTVAGNLVDRVKEAASEAQKTVGDEVGNAVSETQKTINNEAKNQGLA